MVRHAWCAADQALAELAEQRHSSLTARRVSNQLEFTGAATSSSTFSPCPPKDVIQTLLPNSPSTAAALAALLRGTPVITTACQDGPSPDCVESSAFAGTEREDLSTRVGTCRRIPGCIASSSIRHVIPVAASTCIHVYEVTRCLSLLVGGSSDKLPEFDYLLDSAQVIHTNLHSQDPSQHHPPAPSQAWAGAAHSCACTQRWCG